MSQGFISISEGQMFVWSEKTEEIYPERKAFTPIFPVYQKIVHRSWYNKGYINIVQVNQEESKMKQPSFFRTMIEEKGLSDHMFEKNHNGLLHIMEMEMFITQMENAPTEERKTIEKAMRQIDFFNGDLLPYLHFLFKCYLETQYPGK